MFFNLHFKPINCIIVYVGFDSCNKNLLFFASCFVSSEVTCYMYYIRFVIDSNGTGHLVLYPLIAIYFFRFNKKQLFFLFPDKN